MLVRAAFLVALTGVVPVPAPAPVLREYVISRPGNFPHDPAVSADGIVWYTDQTNSYIGRLDPASGAISDYPTPTPKSGPHGITVAPDGGVWYTAQRTGIIGRLDPSTKQVREYALPARTANPHTPIWFGGAVWYTDANNNTYGRLDPSTGSVQVYESTTENSVPYGIVSSPDGHVWIALLGTNKLAQVDTATGAMKEFILPAGARPRRLQAASNGIVWYTDYARGYLGALDPVSGKVREWPSPVPGEGPYGIAIGPDGAIWYNHARSDAMTRFDPVTEKSTVLQIPTPGAIVRHMVTDAPRGRIWLALSGTGRLGVIELGH
jgi:virginiamycin B lyase